MRDECYIVVALSLCFALALCGCGSGSSGGGVANVTLQVLQEDASEGTISVSLDGQVISGSLAYQQNSGPITAKSGSGTLAISGPGVAGPMGSNTISTPVEFADNGHYTFVTDGFGDFSSASILLTDDTTPAGNSNVKLRIVNCAITDTSAVDVYVLPFGQTPSGTPTLSKLAYNANGSGGAAPSYQSVSAGDYDIYFTVIGTTQVLYHTGQLTFSADQNRTVLFLNNCPACSAGSSSCTCDLSTLYTAVVLDDLN